MTELLTEQEQIEQLKSWIKQYGFTVLAGIVIALISVSLWHVWQNYQTKKLTHASSVFDEMLTARAQNDTASLENARAQADKLLRHYAHTPYAQFAALMLARDAIAQQKYPIAVTQLNWVLDHGKDKALKQIAQLRLARIFITENKARAALTLLTKPFDTNFTSLLEEVKGDALLQLKDDAGARTAYQNALMALPKDETAEKPVLQMKLDNLATL